MPADIISSVFRQRRDSRRARKHQHQQKVLSDLSDVSDISDRDTSSTRSGSSAHHEDIASSLPLELVTAYLNNQSSPSYDPDVDKKDQAFILPLLDSTETSELLAVSGTLGVDPSSEHFANRTKSIAFVLNVEGRWFQINQDYFNQASEYNDFSGGYKRFYDELPRQFIQSSVTQRLLTNFQTIYNIPEGHLILVQVQSSNISPDDEGKCLTGQGIHSDGADRAMLVCLERDNVVGAHSSVFEDADGEKPLIDRVVLEEGNTMFWKDNEIYHYVEPARLEDHDYDGTRTVLIAHYPAMHYITGKTNQNNVLPPSGKHPKGIETKHWIDGDKIFSS